MLWDTPMLRRSFASSQGKGRTQLPFHPRQVLQDRRFSQSLKVSSYGQQYRAQADRPARGSRLRITMGAVGSKVPEPAPSPGTPFEFKPSGAGSCGRASRHSAALFLALRKRSKRSNAMRRNHMHLFLDVSRCVPALDTPVRLSS